MKLFNSDFFGKMTLSHSTRGIIASRRLLNPVREWLVSLLVVLLVAGGLFAYAGWEFYRQFTDAGIPEVSEEHIPRYRALDAELLIRYYEGKEALWNERTQAITTEPLSTPVLGVIPKEDEDETPISQDEPRME